MTKADIGVMGLAVMGENLILNMESHGFTVAAYNRTTSKVDEFRREPCHRQGHHRHAYH
jgi:6-phosphogluconate dehydrogenase